MNFTVGKMRHRHHRAIGLLVGLWFCVAGIQAIAAEPEWPAGIYTYIPIDQRVSEALQEFGRNVGLPVRVSDRVEGRLSHGMPIGTAREFLTWICDRYGLVWYYDGAVLHIAAESELRTEMVKLATEEMRSMRARLERVGISNPRFPIRLMEDDNLMSVSGPPAYIAAVKKALGLLSEGDGGVRSVRVFRGKDVAATAVPASN
ncbi:type III secretion protein [Chelativorans salis]|uniref:Type III secretion protein n=1 Tax=Chelativorans salis TaxID=2978478 RepID=A0ABT2LQL0_9HYPH|nr:type III secretion protein [Chelativorans sp. EGI FJ00035]MCT7376840.1 type III secretion protein [Chelativorans sp. EGI FJ00035]